MCFAPTTSHPHHRASPTSLTCPRINTATDRRPKPRAQPTLPHLLSPRYTLSPFSHSRVPIPILGSFAASARLPPRPRDPRHSPHFSFCHSNPQPCILPTPPILPLHSDLHRRLSRFLPRLEEGCSSSFSSSSSSHVPRGTARFLWAASVQTRPTTPIG